jgi:hypothetical protein
MTAGRIWRWEDPWAFFALGGRLLLGGIFHYRERARNNSIVYYPLLALLGATFARPHTFINRHDAGSGWHRVFLIKRGML